MPIHLRKEGREVGLFSSNLTADAVYRKQFSLKLQVFLILRNYRSFINVILIVK